MYDKEREDTLLDFAAITDQHKEWASFARYCRLREKGLRKEAFKELNVFLGRAERWDLDQRIEFVRQLYLFVEQHEHGVDLFSQPLSERLLKPTLSAWCDQEQADPAPFRWFGIYYADNSYLYRALELDPNDEKAKVKLIDRMLYQIYFAIHHLPDGYLGDAEADIEQTHVIKKEIAKLSDRSKQVEYLKRLDEDVEILENYLAWKASGEANFAEWGQRHQKTVGYSMSTNI